MTAISLSGSLPASDAIIVGVSPGRRNPSVVGDGLSPAAKRSVQSSLQALKATGSLGEVHTIARVGGVKADVVVAVGLGEDDDRESLRRAVGNAVRSASGYRRITITLPVGDPEAVTDIATAALLGAYQFNEFRTKAKPTPTRITIYTKNARAREFTLALHRAEIIGSAVNRARDLVNTPPGHLPPAELATRAKEAVRDLPVKVQIRDEKALATGGFGGILAVGQGSAHPPRLITMTYAPRGATTHLALVGKGITFDSGGLSLKPAKAMETMKCDMGGAAAVLSAVTAIAELKLPIAVTGYVPTAENMPSGTAQRPGDVITIYGGKTVEVLNTDAEGRLILADALVLATESEPDYIVDAATLTGAAMVALGSRLTGVMSNDDDFRERVFTAAEDSGEAAWQMPLPRDLRASMDSPIADIANIGDRMGGMLVAGLFLSEFVPGDLPWTHLDIAGPAFNEGGPYGYTPKGGTGAAVRTFISLAEDLAST